MTADATQPPSGGGAKWQDLGVRALSAAVLIPVVLHTKYFKAKNTLTPAQKILNFAVVLIGGGMSAVAVVDSSLRLLKLKK